MGLKNQYLLLLFVFGVVARGLVKVRSRCMSIMGVFANPQRAFFRNFRALQTAFGANVSLALVLAVALYYYVSKRKEASVYDDIARLQAESAAKIDALHGHGDGQVKLSSRQTQFQLRPEEASIVT